MGIRIENELSWNWQINFPACDSFSRAHSVSFARMAARSEYSNPLHIHMNMSNKFNIFISNLLITISQPISASTCQPNVIQMFVCISANPECQNFLCLSPLALTDVCCVEVHSWNMPSTFFSHSHSLSFSLYLSLSLFLCALLSHFRPSVRLTSRRRGE